ncbi:hypothetical protein B0A49_05383 [Cryomyces minteri]|uniref:HECT-type E3 ubiquitin transferase n=1 Tax=Cryomyces minteri TaxID=331657 RepID=A0A4U0XHA9_9PEZI|nr:hypothetical protein B0A49_05383 [Cryomyces minteri]
MGRIKKTATSRHEATLSPALVDFIEATTSIPLYQIPSHLASFPRRWPFPRGDLYNWITVLNRFDHVLELFNQEYGLLDGPQTQPFETRLLVKGDNQEDRASSFNTPPNQQTLSDIGFSEEGDRELVEQILLFTRVLLENCGNRSLYSSSGHLNSLLNTTSTSLLKATLRLSLRLAQRYHASRQRLASTAQLSPLLASHFNIDLEKVQKLALPFVQALPPTIIGSTSTQKGKDKAVSRVDAVGTSDASDLVSIVKEQSSDASAYKEWAAVSFTYYESSSAWSSLGPTGRKPALPDNFASPTHPTTLTPTRRSSNLGPNQTPRTRGGAVSDEANSPVTPYQSEQSRHPGPKVVNISSETILNTPVYEVVKTALSDVPVDAQYELLHTIRVAHALSSSRSSRQDMVAIRLLAIANLAYIHTESAFQQKISQQDSDQPRRLQLAQQLSELIHPPGNGESGTPRELQTLAISTLEALAKHKHKAAEVCTALSVNVNHGVLFYVVRKAVAELANDDDPADNFDEDDWREALFSLLITLPSSSPSARTGEAMVAAGLLDILVEILTLRTSKAERNHPKVLNFLENYVYNLRDAFQALINAKGLTAIADLTSYEVETSFVRAQNGDGMPDQYKTKAVDYKIPYYQQQTIRWLFKFMNHMLSHSNGAFDRVLRNLIDSPQLLNALRKAIDNAPIFGSNVWSGAVNILSSFIHNEPTSYQVIAEAGLSRSVLEAVTQTSIPEPDSAPKAGSTSVKPRLAQGILPVAETIQTVPHAFGAICLNESGMKLFQASDALEKFFEVFQSPAHVRALNDDQDAPTVLGSSFDELVRHHPPLKDIVMRSVMNMASKVALLSFNQASEKGAGAALWAETKEGKLLVAGGRNALSGHEPPHTARYEKLSERQLKEDHARANGTDVEMQDALAPIEAGPSQSNTDFSFDDFLNLNPADGSGDREAAEDYVSVACRFLIGFFSNSSMCAAFCESGGMDILLNFATLPSYECNFYQLPVYDEIAKVVQQMVEQKPHLTLPSLIKRTQYAVDLLEPVVNHNKDFAYFSVFTDRSYSPPPDCLDWFEDVKSKGTLTVKSLTIVHTLCNILSSALESTTYHHRSSHDLLSRVNLTDMYVQLIESLGKLHSACLWEEILMQQNVPESWKETTRIKATGLGTDEANNVLDIITLDRRHNAANSPEPESGKRGNEDESPGSTIDQGEDTAQHKNIDTLRYLLNQIPTVVMPLFQNVGKMLLFRRSIDAYQKQNAAMVAESLTSSCLQQLQYPPPSSASPDDKCAYDAISLTTLVRILIDRNGLDRGFPQALTLILQCFKNQGGFRILGEILETYEKRVLEASSTAANGTDGVTILTMSCIKTILDLYSQVTNSKCITEASQTTAMAGSNGARDRANPQYFLPAQFLVELRYALLPSVRRLWTSNLVDKATTSIVKCLIDTLRMVLDGDAEAGAYRRSDKLPPRVKPEPKKWKPKSIDQITTLTSQGFDENLAREALFRCNDHLTTAKEYCEFYRYDPTTTPNPIPKGEIQQSRSQNSPVRPVSDSNEAPSTTEDTDTADTDLTTAQRLVERLGAALAIPDDSLSFTAEAGNLFSASISNLLNRASGDAAEAGPPGSAPPGPSPSTIPRPETDSDAGKIPDVVTIDDLNDERDILRKDLIDRCLDVLNVHNDVTFELAELISAAVSKATDPAGLRKEIGETIVQSLSSLQMEDDIRPNSRKIASYAHLVALVLQEKGYDTTLDELKENLPMLLAFLKPLPDRTVEESSPWVGYILLIIEKLLEQDEQPNKIVFQAPTGDNPFEDQPLAEHKDLVVSPEARSSLFEAILLLLPQVGKDESLALSIVRVLVILTRTRTLATRLGEKHSMQRLFVMVKQLAGITNERLQSAFLLVLRHVVEDDATIRQIMRSEIQAHFTHGSGRDRRPVDTTNYTRNLYHLVLRQPEIFVEVTNEMLELTKFDTSQRPQVLSLKKQFSLQEGPSPGDVPRNAASSEEKMKAEDTKPLTETKPEEDRSRGTAEVKPPVVENPDGVIHYLLSELLSYKDVEDKEQVTPVQGHSKDPVAMDVDMTIDESTPTPGPSTPNQAGSVQPAAGVPEQKRSDKPEFKPDQHPIYIYRCFILQCLTELLSCYNRTKVEFINFSRKADPQFMTPSKPRSGVLNYLLNALIPVGTISNAEDITFRKKSSTSNWAISVIVSLCSKTGEHGLANIKDRGFSNHEDEPELVYVRKFVLEHALKVYKEASASNESLDVKYSRLLTLSDLFNRMLTGKPNSGSSSFSVDVLMSSQALLAKIMYEKNFTGALTSSIADIDLNFPGAKRVVKYILRPLKLLTQTTIRLSESSDISSTSPGLTEEDEISSATSMSDMGEDREETPDLLRNSTLGMFDASREEESDSEGEDDDGEEMYDEEYDEGMEYDEEPPDHDDVISDEDEEIEGMGPIEGMSGDVNMDLEIVVDGHEHDMSEDDEDDDEDEDSNTDDDDDDDDDMDDDIEAMGEVTGDDGDGSLADHEEEWEEEDGGIGYEGQEYFDDGVGSPHAGPLDHVVRVLNGDDPQSRLEMLDRLAADEELDMDIEQEYLEDEMPEDEDEDDEEDFDEEDIVYEPGTEGLFPSLSPPLNILWRSRLTMLVDTITITTITTGELTLGCLPVEHMIQ